MAIDKLQFTRDWTKPEDFKTIETDEAIIRADAQALHNEARDFINNKLIPAVDENTGKAHTHDNKALLDTYTQSEENLADAVSKKHEHENKELLDTYTQTEENLADAVSKKHVHKNKELLDAYTQTEENLADAVSKKHVHENKELLDAYTQTEEQISGAVSKAHEHENMNVLSGIKAVTQELTNTEDEVPSGKAVSTALTQSGLLPGGGLTGQVLTKISDLAFEMDWQDPSLPTPENIGAAPTYHTHTPEQAGAAPVVHSHTADEVGSIRVYNSLAELGLTEASDAVAIVNAMENYSMLLYTMSGTATSGGLGAPFNWGTLRVIKLTSSYTEFTLSSGPSKSFAYYNAGSSGDKWSGWRTMSDTTHNHSAGDITSGTLGVARGGTGATTFTSGAALIGAGTGAVTTRAITNNTSASGAITGSTNLVTMNTLRYALNRTTGPGNHDTNYTTFMMRVIAAATSAYTAGTTALASGAIYLQYE